MKKMNNKGFSLVELIIVIAIMAILAASIAPALIRYIDKSRKANDVTAAGTIKTAVDSALANEDAYSEVISALGNNASVLVAQVSDGAISAVGTTFKSEVSQNLSTIPSVKYKKDGATGFKAYVIGGGSVKIDIYGGSSAWEIQPTMHASYK